MQHFITEEKEFKVPLLQKPNIFASYNITVVCITVYSKGCGEKSLHSTYSFKGKYVKFCGIMNDKNINGNESDDCDPEDALSKPQSVYHMFPLTDHFLKTNISNFDGCKGYHRSTVINTPPQKVIYGPH